jgi:putative tryptophan/tyrosine transport system substrate-binding protein
MSYGANKAETYVCSASTPGKFSKERSPGDLPIQRSTQVELIINLKTAKAHGISVPLPLAGRAEELIE